MGASACGIPLAFDSAMISKSIFDHGLKGNSSSVCGHKIWAQGSGRNGNTVEGGSLTLTVVSYCKCTALKQPCDRDGKLDQCSRHSLRTWRPHRAQSGLRNAE